MLGRRSMVVQMGCPRPKHHSLPGHCNEPWYKAESGYGLSCTGVWELRASVWMRATWELYAGKKKNKYWLPLCPEREHMLPLSTREPRQLAIGQLSGERQVCDFLSLERVKAKSLPNSTCTTITVCFLQCLVILIVPEFRYSSVQ